MVLENYQELFKILGTVQVSLFAKTPGQLETGQLETGQLETLVSYFNCQAFSKFSKYYRTEHNPFFYKAFGEQWNNTMYEIILTPTELEVQEK